jgi:protein SCO1/2
MKPGPLARLDPSRWLTGKRRWVRGAEWIVLLLAGALFALFIIPAVLAADAPSAQNASSRSPQPLAAAFKAGVFEPPHMAPDFTLQGSDGQALRLSRFRGKVVLLGFGFSSCTEVCPVTLDTLAKARRSLGATAEDVQVLYITVDPERDVPERMKAYLRGFDPTFIGGSGTAAQLAAVQKSYGVQAEKRPSGDDYSYSHSSSTFFIDRSGRLRAQMLYGHSPSDYAHDLKLLLKE